MEIRESEGDINLKKHLSKNVGPTFKPFRVIHHFKDQMEYIIIYVIGKG